MGFDILTILLVVLSLMSVGVIAPLEEMPFGVGTVWGSAQNAKPWYETTSESVSGSDLIAGTWGGSASVPFMVSVTFKAVVAADGTARFSGTVSSTLFGNHVFDTPASWEYLGGSSFDTVISGVHTPVTCDGHTLTFPINPYRLGLVDNPIADQNFIIDLHHL